jgi:hypothetical protein
VRISPVRVLLTRWNGHFTNPGRELLPVEPAVRYAKHGINYVRLRRLDLATVEDQKDVGCNEGDALVAIEESMVPGQAEGVLCGERCKVGVRLATPDVPRPGQRRLEQPASRRPCWPPCSRI